MDHVLYRCRNRLAGRVVALTIRRSALRLFLVGYLVLAIGCTFGLYKGYYLAQDGKQAKHALCAFQDSARQRYTDTEKYLDDVREGRRQLIPGLTEADLVRSLRRDRDTLDSIAFLDC